MNTSKYMIKVDRQKKPDGQHNPNNYGHQLYMRGRNQEMNKLLKIEEGRRIQEFKELEGVTF